MEGDGRGEKWISKDVWLGGSSRGRLATMCIGDGFSLVVLRKYGRLGVAVKLCKNFHGRGWVVRYMGKVTETWA